MASRLRMPAAQIKEALRQLEAKGILMKDGDGWTDAHGSIFILRNSPMSGSNQTNWRQRAIFNIQSRDPESLHCLQLNAVKRGDFIKLKAVLVEAL